MAQRGRVLDDLAADAPRRVVMNIRPAHTQRVDTYQHIARPLQDRPRPFKYFQRTQTGEARHYHHIQIRSRRTYTDC